MPAVRHLCLVPEGGVVFSLFVLDSEQARAISGPGFFPRPRINSKLVPRRRGSLRTHSPRLQMQHRFDSVFITWYNESVTDEHIAKLVAINFFPWICNLCRRFKCHHHHACSWVQ